MVGKQGRLIHDARVREVEVEALEADEQHGLSVTKQQAAWEAEVMAHTKLILAHEKGRRDEEMIRRLYQYAAQCVANRHNLVLFTVNGTARRMAAYQMRRSIPFSIVQSLKKPWDGGA